MMATDAVKILHNRYIKGNPEREASVEEERQIAAMERVIEALVDCHTHPGKERTLNEGRDCYAKRVKHSHVIIDLEPWQKVRKALLDLGILGG